MILAVVMLVVVLGGLYVLWRKKKGADAAEEGGQSAGPKAARPPKVPKPPPNRFVNVWRRFLAALPSVYRRSIVRFQPFVVLGTAASGKSALISRYTDWRRQANQFLSSESEDANLQVYMSSHAVVLEVPSDVLHDTSSHVRNALLRLYRRVFRGRKPISVVVVNVQHLQTLQPDAVRNLADLVRGKLNLVAESAKGTIELRIALSHADCIPGFNVFSRFAAKEGLSASLLSDLDVVGHRDEVLQALEKGCAEFDKLAPLALTRLAATEYLQVVAFLRAAPDYLAPLSTFLSALCASDPVSFTPALERVYFTHPTQGDPTQENPFRVQNIDEEQLPNPLARHRWYSIAASACLLGYLGAGFVYERSLWQPARAALTEYANASGPDRPALRETIRAFRDRKANNGVVRYFPNFFGHVDKEIDDTLARVIRTNTILPGVQKSLSSVWAPRQSLYLLSLLESSRTNELGSLVLRESAHWSTATGLDASLIQDYVRSASDQEHHVSLVALGLASRSGSNTAVAPPGSASESTTPLTTNNHASDSSASAALHKPRPIDASNDARPWSMFFMRLQRAMSEGPMSETELVELQDESRALSEMLKIIQRFRYADKALGMLEDVYGSEIRTIYAPFQHETHAASMFNNSLSDVEYILSQVQSGGLASSTVRTSRLTDLCAQLSLTLSSAPESKSDAIAVPVEDRVFSFSEREWNATMQKIQAKRLILDFIRQANKNEDSIFFADDEGTPASLLSARKENSYLFTGKPGLPSRYTRAAFDRSVRPVLIELATLKDTLPLRPVEFDVLENFVFSEMEVYAREYANALDQYYFAFGVNADSADALQVLVKEMLRPGSPFGTLLRTIDINSRLDLETDDIRYFEPLQDALAHYEPLQNALRKQQDGYQEISTYHSILEQLLVSLRNGGAVATTAGNPAVVSDGAIPTASETAQATKESQPSATVLGSEQRLTDLLQPAGRVALAMYRGEPGSYLSMVQGWLDGAGIREDLAGPFLAPVLVLYSVGMQDIEKVVSDVWQHKLMTELQKAVTKFPFSRKAEEDITASTLETLFHPQSGTFQSIQRRLLSPVLQAESPPYLRGIQTPLGMKETLKRVEKLSAVLWDGEGKPRKLRLRVSSVPFTAASSKKGVMTLAFLSTGSSSLFNFNQQPTITALDLDWTTAQRAQLGIELTSPVSGEKSYPNPIFGKTSPWSLLHLLQKGERTGDVVTWRFQVGKDAVETASIRFTLHDDLIGQFDLLHDASGHESPDMTQPAANTTTATLSMD